MAGYSGRTAERTWVRGRVGVRVGVGVGVGVRVRVSGRGQGWSDLPSAILRDACLASFACRPAPEPLRCRPPLVGATPSAELFEKQPSEGRRRESRLAICGWRFPPWMARALKDFFLRAEAAVRMSCSLRAALCRFSVFS